MKQPKLTAGYCLALLFLIFFNSCRKTADLSIHQFPFVVTQTSPSNHHVGASFDEAVTATLNNALDTTKYSASLVLMNNENFLKGNISFDGKLIAFIPEMEMDPLSEYTARLSINEKNKTAQSVYTFQWKFTTKKQDQYLMTQRSTRVTDFVRDGTKMMQIGNYLYSFGGWNVPEKSYNDVYRSSGNLQTWKKRPDAPWHGRHTHGIAKIGDTTYIVGGDYLQPQFDVWLTTDGETWTKTAENILGNRILYACAEHNGYIYVVGGQGYNDVWRSRGGVHWEQVTNYVPFLKGENFAGSLTSFNGRLWMVCGGGVGTGDGRASTEVWSSGDGKIWKRENDIGGSGRQYTDVCVWDNKLWVIGGYNSTEGNLKSIRYMKPNGTWVEFETPADYLARHATGVAVYNNKLVITCGNYHNDCWVIEKID